LCPGCGQIRRDIGVDRSEQLEYRPASMLVVEHVVHKYACSCNASSPALAAAAPGEAAPESEPMSPQQPDPATPARAAPAAPPDRPATEPGPAPPPPRPAVIAAAKPALPIAKGLPGPGLLAHLIVS
jgi:transposase